MDQKTWLWRKRSSEKTIVANGDEAQSVVPIKKEVDLENCLKSLNEKLDSVLDECCAKDGLVESCKKMADDAVADKDRAEEEARRLRGELDAVLQQRDAVNEELGHLNSALKGSMDQLNAIRGDQEQRVHDAVVKASQEFKNAHKMLEEKLLDMSKRLMTTTAESSYLGKALLVKEELIEDLNNVKSQTEAEFKALMTRLDSTEKENAFLRYEFRTLEKELNLRNEELEYCHRSNEASHKQHLESVKKIKKLEADCQRLRTLTRKRMPCPAVLANIRSDFEVQRRHQIDSRGKSIAGGPVVNESGAVYSPDNASKKLGFLIEQVQDLEKENKVLKECLAKREEEILDYQKAKNSEVATASSFGLVDSNEVTSCHSWDNALVSEGKSDKFRGRRAENECKMIGAPDMSLMDDFVEMEKLAIVAVDVPLGSFAASNVSHTLLDSSKENSESHMNSVTKEIVPFGNSEFSDVESEGKPKDPLSDWLKNAVDAILEQHCISKRSLEDLLGDVRIALNNSVHPEPPKLLPISGYITWKSPASTPRSDSVQESSNEFLQPDVNVAVAKIIKLIGQFDVPHSEDFNLRDDLLVKDSNTSWYMGSPKVANYKVHVFRWKSSGLTTVLREFLCSCNCLLDGKLNFEKFIGDLASMLGWIIDNSVAYEDHSSIRDEFRKHLGGDGPGTALELDCVQSLMLEMEKMFSILQVEIKGLKEERKSVQFSNKDSALMQKFLQSQEIIASLQNELEVLKESRRMTEDEIDNMKLVNEDLETQLSSAKSKLNEVLQRLSCVEVELDNKCHRCNELEGTCLELQLQLESMSKNQCLEGNGNQEELLQTGMEITRASAKLAECEETILKLGKQLKEMGSIKELSVVDKVLSITSATNKMFKQRSSLRDQMLSEDGAEVRRPQSSNDKWMVSKSEANARPSVSRTNSQDYFSFPDGHIATADKYVRAKKEPKATAKAGALVIVPSKKRGGGISLLTKLLLRRKKSGCKSATTSLW